MNKVSTGFLLPTTVIGSKSGSKTGGSYGLQTVGSMPTRHPSASVEDRAVILGDNKVGHYTATGRGDAASDKSFGSQAVMVR